MNRVATNIPPMQHVCIKWDCIWYVICVVDMRIVNKLIDWKQLGSWALVVSPWVYFSHSGCAKSKFGVLLRLADKHPNTCCHSGYCSPRRASNKVLVQPLWAAGVAAMEAGNLEPQPRPRKPAQFRGWHIICFNWFKSNCYTKITINHQKISKVSLSRGIIKFLAWWLIYINLRLCRSNPRKTHKNTHYSSQILSPLGRAVALSLLWCGKSQGKLGVFT